MCGAGKKALLVALLLAALAVQAEAAIIYASSASVLGTPSATLTGASNSTGPPDGSRMTIRTWSATPVTATVRYTFTEFRTSLTGNSLTVVVDTSVQGNVAATIVGVNAHSSDVLSSSTTANMTGGSGQDQTYPISYDLTSYANVTTVDVLFQINYTGGQRAVVRVDTLYVSAASVPEPATAFLAGLGFLGLLTIALFSRRQKRARRYTAPAESTMADSGEIRVP
jgi:hypothetical protein